VSIHPFQRNDFEQGELSMNTIRNTVARKGAWLSTIALVAAMHLGDAAYAQATPKPPERMTYQGFIAGSDGVALGNTAPKNYDVIFRVYDAETAGTLIWGEQQTVTVDKGYFSVLLGEGAPVSGVPNAGITLSSLFDSATASDRYVGFTVKGIGSGGADVDILPRARMMSAPYAFLASRAVLATLAETANVATTALTATTATNALTATRATNAISAVKLINNSTGADLVTSTGTQVSVGGGITVTNNSTFNSNLTVGSLYSNGSVVHAGLLIGSGIAETAMAINVGNNVVNGFPLYVGNGSFGYSIMALQAIGGSAFLVQSDRRVKDVIGMSDDSKDLENLRKIRVTDYTMKFGGVGGKSPTKGVIAQELGEILPNAVSTGRNVVSVPAQDAVSVAKDGPQSPLIVRFAAAHGFQKDERLRLEMDGRNEDFLVVNVPDEKSIELSGSPTSAPKQVRVIGRQVDDFQSVDYQQVYMTAISALQQVDRRLQLVEQREAKVMELERKAARVESLERDVAELRKLVAGIQAGASKNAGSASVTGSASGAVASSR
jgi:hypothetical protein